MRKKLTIFVAGVLMAAVLAGCGGKSDAGVSDTVKWMNTTYAMLTSANGGNINLIGGYKKNSVNEAIVQGGLESSWSVTDRATADETLDWILSEGHRMDFLDDMDAMQQDGLMDLSDNELKTALASYGFTEDEAACYVEVSKAYKENGEHAIDAWDYCRALQLLGWYYVAGYYTEQETLDKSLEIATTLQQQFGSWDELAESYLVGYNYWSTDDPNDPESDTAARRKVYTDLKNSKENPYTLDWNTKLEKTW